MKASANRFIRAVSALGFAALFSMSAQAAIVTTSGNLPDAPVGAYHLYNFEVTNDGLVDLLLQSDTDAWLGVFKGTNVLSNANFIAQDDDSGGGLNSFLRLSLTAGNYTAWITTHGSVWNTNANAITIGHDHTPTNYTLTINGDVQASTSGDVPEPASLALLGLGLAGCAAVRRRKG